MNVYNMAVPVDRTDDDINDSTDHHRTSQSPCG